MPACENDWKVCDFQTTKSLLARDSLSDMQELWVLLFFLTIQALFLLIQKRNYDRDGRPPIIPPGVA
jgi:hypothetical protein